MINLLLLFIGLVALYAGGELLVRTAVVIGAWLGMSTLVTGLTIVALGTSAPELAVSLDAAIVGSTEIAISNVVGSNFANISLVLALSAVMLPIAIEPLVLRRDLPIMLAGFVASLVMILDGEVSHLDGLLLLFGLLSYLAYVIWYTRKQRIARIREEHMVRSVSITLIQLAAGVLLLSFGGHLLVNSAVNIAQALGVSCR